MTADKTAGPSPSYWMVTAFLMVFSLASASIYVRFLTVSPAEFAATYEHGPNTAPYLAYVENIPAWSIAVGAAAAATRLIGVICLLIRRKLALSFLALSLALLLVAMFRAFALAGAASVMSG